MSNKNVRMTKNYSLFERANNRDIDPSLVARKKKMLVEQGWIWTQPMTVKRLSSGRLLILDGQHRFSAAMELDMAVCFAVLEDKEDVAVPSMNSNVTKWNATSYCQFYIKTGGNGDYREVQDFAEKHGVPLTDAAGFLCGTGWSNVRDQWQRGEYKIRAREYAADVAWLWVNLRAIPGIKGNKSLRLALCAVVRDSGFDPARLVVKAKRIPERFAVVYATRDGALAMLEEVYNYGCREGYPLKINAENAMRDRNPVVKKQ